MPGRLRIAILVLAATAASACHDSLAPLNYDLGGSWVSGFRVEESYVIALQQSGSTLTGTGMWTRNINPPTLALTVSGTDDHGHVKFRLLSGGVDWFLDFDGIATVRNDSAMLTGTASFMGGASDTLTFLRVVPQAPAP